MRILLFSRYGALGASSRVRFLQYLPYFQSQGIEFNVSPLLSDKYLQAIYERRSCWSEVIKGYVIRIFFLLRVWRFDVVIIEKELFPFMPAFAEQCLRLANVKYIVDYDDALFHRYDSHSNFFVRFFLRKKIDTVMRCSNYVMAGNDYIADRAYRAGAKLVKVIPTTVDTDRYGDFKNLEKLTPIIGWIGTPQTSHYLKLLLPAFEVLQLEMSVRFVAIGANAEDFEGTPIEVWPWTEATEVRMIQQFYVGIMPLEDSPWERGKCGYKLIQYMACGVPTIASPVGVNCDIVQSGVTGYLASSKEEWINAFRFIFASGFDKRNSMGRVGQQIVKDKYSISAQGPCIVDILKSV